MGDVGVSGVEQDGAAVWGYENVVSGESGVADVPLDVHFLLDGGVAVIRDYEDVRVCVAVGVQPSKDASEAIVRLSDGAVRHRRSDAVGVLRLIRLGRPD